MIRRVEGLLIEPEDCLLLDSLLIRGMKDAVQRNGGAPARAEQVVAEFHQYAVQCRETEFRAGPQVKAPYETVFDRPGFVSRSSEATEWLSVREVAQLAEVSEQYVRRMAEDKVIAGDRNGHRGARRLNANSVAAWLAARRSDHRAA